MSFKVAKETVLLSLMVKTGRDRVGAGIPGRALHLDWVRRDVPVIKCPLLGDGWYPIRCPSLGIGDINPAPPSQARTSIARKAPEHPCSTRLAERSRLRRLFSIQDNARQHLSRHVCWWGRGSTAGGLLGGGSQPTPAALSRAGGDLPAPVFPRSPQGMLSRGLPDPSAAILSEHLRRSYNLLAR